MAFGTSSPQFFHVLVNRLHVIFKKLYAHQRKGITPIAKTQFLFWLAYTLANMVNLVSKFSIIGAVIFGVLYQFIFKSLIFNTLGYGRVVSPLEHFDKVRCKKITEPGLEACEHMWLHHPTGYLYMACSSSKGAMNWVPALVSSYFPILLYKKLAKLDSVDRLNASGRSLSDRIAILDTRAPGSLSSRLKWLTVEGFTGVKRDGTLNLHGFDIRTDKNTNTLRILLINHRPPFHPITGEPLDAYQVGANSTIEQFQTVAGGEIMHHVRTYSNDMIETPNSVHWVNDHAFVFTNDHSSKVGFVSFHIPTWNMLIISATNS